MPSFNKGWRESAVVTWIEPAHSKSRVNWAGSVLATASRGVLVEAQVLREALDIAGNWRSAHAFPLNALQNGLRQHVRKVCSHAVVSQRLKRIQSTAAKLGRFKRMKLSRMQDVGGCRAVVDTVEQVEELRSRYGRSRTKHQAANGRDYIACPQASGYRGVHLVYRYRSPKNPAYNGLLVEIQLRTRLQHAWATAVETAGAFLGQALKSSEGERDWLRFFALAGSAFASEEGRSGVPGAPADLGALRGEIRALAQSLEVQPRLIEYGALIADAPVFRAVERWHFVLVERRPDEGRLYVIGYARGELAKVTSDYRDAEERVRDIDGAEVVLVSVDSLQALRRAYPNYYLDATLFLKELTRIVGK